MRVLIFSVTHVWDHSREWCYCWLVCRSIHKWDEDNFILHGIRPPNTQPQLRHLLLLRDARCGHYLILSKSETRSYSIDRDTIDIWYSASLRKVRAEALIRSTRFSTNRRRGWYSIPNESSETPLGTQAIIGEEINTQAIIRVTINSQQILL